MRKKYNQKEFDQVLDNFFKTYQDRGMKKWQGMMLSDHTATINRDNQQRAVVYSKKPTMSEEQSSELLMTAYANHRQVAVQLKELDVEGHIQPDIVGFVEGYHIDEIMISENWVDLSNINKVDMRGYDRINFGRVIFPNFFLLCYKNHFGMFLQWFFMRYPKRYPSSSALIYLKALNAFKTIFIHNNIYRKL